MAVATRELIMIASHARRTQHPAQPYAREVDTYNAAFEDLGVEWRLELAVYARHAAIADARARLCACIETQYPHLLKVYDRDFIGNVVAEATALQAHPRAHAGRH